MNKAMGLPDKVSNLTTARVLSEGKSGLKPSPSPGRACTHGD